MRQRALFLDRDGTLVYPVPYPSRPEDLCLYADLGPELSALQARGFRLIIVTNQSGVALGYFRTVDLERMHTALAAHLRTYGVELTGIYACPHHPQGVIPEFATACACRKPHPGLLLQAAAEHHIDLASSWMVGDILDDVEAGKRAGCRTILVDLGTEAPPDHALRQPDFVARTTCHALQIIQALERAGQEQVPVDLTYQPASWQHVGRGAR